eukprot:6177446-Pleurochrysis_carterae.AAC.5
MYLLKCSRAFSRILTRVFSRSFSRLLSCGFSSAFGEHFGAHFGAHCGADIRSDVRAQAERSGGNWESNIIRQRGQGERERSALRDASERSCPPMMRLYKVSTVLPRWHAHTHAHARTWSHIFARTHSYTPAFVPTRSCTQAHAHALHPFPITWIPQFLQFPLYSISQFARLPVCSSSRITLAAYVLPEPDSLFIRSRRSHHLLCVCFRSTHARAHMLVPAHFKFRSAHIFLNFELRPLFEVPVAMALLYFISGHFADKNVQDVDAKPHYSLFVISDLHEDKASELPADAV